MRAFFIVGLVLSFMAMFAGCGGDDGPSAPNNNAPLINSIQVSANPVPRNKTAILTVQASDPENDSLIYQWSAPAGSFATGSTGQSVTWVPPQTMSDYSLTLTVSDGKTSVDSTFLVTVGKAVFSLSGFVTNQFDDPATNIYVVVVDSDLDTDSVLCTNGTYEFAEVKEGTIGVVARSGAIVAYGMPRFLQDDSISTLSGDKLLDLSVREFHYVYQDHGIQSVFLGENHFLDMARMQTLIAAIIGEKLNLTFELETHPALFGDETLLPQMVAAGFHRYTMGCESGSNAVLKRMGRKSNATQIVNSVGEIAQRGGIVLTSWISNLPGETESEFRQTQDLMKAVVQAGGFIYWIENLHVLPGTQLYQNPAKWDIEILLKNLADWNRWSLLSKQYVTFEAAYQNPLKYLTHLNRNTSPETMIDRFYSNRKLAASLIPGMKSNLERNFKHGPADIFRAEMQFLDWYERKGWRLWLF